ncbi:MAG: hypothetical protein FWG38_06000 [Defluviitaleaceae bacterium]|nr:hypothetical protein [Defluviitaleaceae bacterium]
MKFLQKLAVENRKLAFYLVALVALGVFALLLGRNTPSPAHDTLPLTEASHRPEALFAASPPAYSPEAFAQERALEARLEAFFTLVEGAGRVRVMVSPLTGRETIFAVDVNKSESFSAEQDAQGGTRETRQQQSQEKTVMVTDRQGTDRPLVLRETEPTLRGVVIIAQGGDNPMVRDALTRAARAVLGLDAHQIQILTGEF